MCQHTSNHACTHRSGSCRACDRRPAADLDDHKGSRSAAGRRSQAPQSQVFDLFSEVLAGIPRASYNTFKKTSRDPRRFWNQLQEQFLSKDPVQVNHLLEKIENLRISMREDGIRTVAQFETLETELVRRGRTLSEAERLRIFQRMI